jgi:methionyl-tRNA formyltransferase
MGSPDFAVISLSALFEAGIKIKAVVTQPDKEQGRGKKLGFTPVKHKALELGLTVLQPKKMKDPDFIAGLKKINADLFVVVAFRILPESVFSIPPFGSVNLHASLLPDYRGAAPINHAIFNGEKETGLTVFYLNSGAVDSGDIIDQKKIPIGDEEDFGSLYEKMSFQGADLLTRTVKTILAGRAVSYKQNMASDKFAPKIFANDFRIDWNNDAEKIFNRIRGLSPKPGAFCYIGDKRIKIISAAFEINEHGKRPGEVIETDAKRGILKIAGTRGCIMIKRIQPENKPAMDISSFLNGHKILPGDNLQ